MNSATLEEARAAKKRLVCLLDGLQELSGVGIARVDGGFGLKVNLEAPTSFLIPAEVDGVPVVTEIIGPVLPV